VGSHLGHLDFSSLSHTLHLFNPLSASLSYSTPFKVLFAGRITIINQREGPAAPFNIPVPLASRRENTTASLAFTSSFSPYSQHDRLREDSSPLPVPSSTGSTASIPFVSTLRANHHSNHKRKDLVETNPLKRYDTQTPCIRTPFLLRAASSSSLKRSHDHRVPLSPWTSFRAIEAFLATPFTQSITKFQTFLSRLRRTWP
jgi:hypothetical protein